MFVKVEPEFFEEIGSEIIRRGKRLRLFKSEKVLRKKYTAFFGTTPFVCSLLWAMLEPCRKMPRGVQPKHLLWALMFLKIYGTEAVNCNLADGVDEKTFRKWAWLFVEGIAALEQGVVRIVFLAANIVSHFGGDGVIVVPVGRLLNCSHHLVFCLARWQILWSSRRLNTVGNEVCYVTVDGTDFMIQEQRKPFWEGWCSHKFNGPGLRYEICVSIKGGDIVWINGPFPCGAWPDLRIFRRKLMLWLDRGEKVEADGGYKGEELFVQTPEWLEFRPEAQQQAARARARHETMNSRLKDFKILSTTFRHNVKDHGSVLRACAVITQIGIKHGGKSLFHCDYDGTL